MSKWTSLLYRCIDSLLIKSWWVVLFILSCYFFYEQGLIKREEDFSRLNRQYNDLLQEKKSVLAEHEALTVQINSQSDPEYVELTLMKGLGLVPEGSTKVLFTEPGLKR